MVTSFSSYSESSFLSRDDNYHSIAELISHYQELYPHIKILPQTLPAFAWYLGGQRYVNTFAHPNEIYEFCRSFQHPICLDISHLYMACAHFKLNFRNALSLLMPCTSHYHVAGASGIDDEGIPLSRCSDEFLESLPLIQHNLESESHKTAIIETWQGHLDNGNPFIQDLQCYSDTISQ